MFVFVALPWLFVVCHFGDEVRIHFEALNESITQCVWYEFPLEMQKCMPMMIQMAQKPVFIGTFGEIHCTREVFKKVYSIILFIGHIIKFNLL